MTEYSRQRDFMFCDMCGTMFFRKTHGHCSLCKIQEINPLKDVLIISDLTDIINSVQNYIRDANFLLFFRYAEDMRRELGTSTLDDVEEEKELQQMDYNAKCKNCQHLGVAYIARQIRSADEGQTIFYTCPICAHKETHNS